MKYLSIFNKSIQAANKRMYLGIEYSSGNFIYKLTKIENDFISYEWKSIDPSFFINYSGNINSPKIDLFTDTFVTEVE